ncbi:uncharacterized protein LOC117217456 [Megalopta genalis]|uniref:uncharacterized protein LOC117217456 n=1 Tax=Megalopta genalis TaxID=115081 RepID=UPI00144354C7|nr:uncharacterized protein LOC117217456 [Megalopta genalis]XP_033320963.1 uncharacterized protein LOC117217456 [Megalopta genalis]
MTSSLVKNPMYALCLLAAVCVRQYVQNRNDQPLTKGLSLQPPTAVFTKPNETILKSVVKDNNDENADKKKRLNEADSLVECVQSFYKRACQAVENVGATIPVSKTQDLHDLTNSSNVLDSILYLTSNVGTKWIA